METNLFEQVCARSTASGRWRVVRLASGLVVVASTVMSGQLPGAPVLQNAWATPGIVGAINVGGGSDGNVYAAAASWTPGSGRFQMSAGLGSRSRTDAGSGAVYGVRLAKPIGGSATSSLGFAAFLGVGGGGSNAEPSSVAPVDTASTTQIPLGVAIGWRRAMGATRGISVYASPSYTFFSGGSKSGGLVRAAAGVDVGITPALGVTVGAEFGQTRRRAVGGPSGTLYGVGVAYAFGRR